MKTLDDLKREVWEALGDEHHLVAQELTLRSVIDHLHAQGRIVPDGYVAVLPGSLELEFERGRANVLSELSGAAAQAPQVNIGVNVGGYVTEGYQSHKDAQKGECK
jgi:hypothetical protein